MYAFIGSSMCTTCPAHLILDFIKSNQLQVKLMQTTADAWNVICCYASVSSISIKCLYSHIEILFWKSVNLKKHEISLSGERCVWNFLGECSRKRSGDVKISSVSAWHFNWQCKELLHWNWLLLICDSCAGWCMTALRRSCKNGIQSSHPFSLKQVFYSNLTSFLRVSRAK